MIFINFLWCEVALLVVVEVSRQLTVWPHLLLVSLPEVSFATEPQEQAWGWVSELFFPPFSFCPPFSFLKRPLSQSCYYVNQLRIVSHFCLPGDRYWASWESKCNSYSKSKEHFYHINLSVLFAHWSYFCMRMCVEVKLASPTPTNLFYQIIRTAEVLPLFADPLRDQTN